MADGGSDRGGRSGHWPKGPPMHYRFAAAASVLLLLGGGAAKASDDAPRAGRRLQLPLQLQPRHNVLEFVQDCAGLIASSSDGQYPPPTAEELARLTGGCGKMTFCNRGANYDAGLYGYKMDGSDQCLTPGPIIKMLPNFTYGLILCSDGDGDPNHPGANLHTHGPHIPGSGNGDDITRKISGGSCGFWEYAIPADHMGGLNWYHPHVHFHTEEQVEGGGLGLLLIGDREQEFTVDTSKGSDVDRNNVYNFLTNEDQRLLVLAAFDVNAGEWKNKNQDNDSKDYNLDAGKWYRLSMLTANPDAAPETVSVSPGCDAHAIAHDGAYRFEPPKVRQDKYYLTGASRIEIAIKCSAGTHLISIAQGWGDEFSTNNGTVWDGVGWDGDQVVAVLNVVDNGDMTGSPGPFLSGGDTWVSYRPEYLKDVTDLPVQNQFTTEIKNNEMNGLEYNADCPLKDEGGDFEFNTVQEWTHTSPNKHPYHLHIYHQQIMGGCGPGHDVGEYYDTTADAAFESENCVVKFKMIDVYGRVIMHCHILKHEDNGAMGWVNVKGGTNPSPSSPCCLSGTCSECVDEDNLPNVCAESTGSPTGGPSKVGVTAGPTKAPTSTPTAAPALPSPTRAPTPIPTTSPVETTRSPSSNPTLNPTTGPTTGPATGPTTGPTTEPTKAPTPAVAAPCPGETEVIVKVTTDNYPEDISWKLTNKCDYTVISNDPIVAGVNNQQECVPNGNYTFVLNDSYGDGLCGGHGEGSYEVVVNGEVVASGCKFTFEQKATFGSCPVEPTKSPSPAPTANPTKAPTPDIAPPCPGETEIIVNVTTDNYPEDISWKLTNKCYPTAPDPVISVLADSIYVDGNTLYSNAYCVPNAKYTFVLYDSYGDGLCCEYGYGSYDVVVNGEAVASGAEFESPQEVTFGSCLE